MNYREVWRQVWARLTDPLRSLPSLVKIAEILAEEIQEADNAAADLVLKRTLADAEGAQLDQWGRVLGEQRLGREDPEYGAALVVRIARNSSEGKPDELIRIAQGMIGSGKIEYREYVPAYGTVVAIDAEIPAGARMARAMDEGVSAGGKIDLIAAGSLAFGFSDDAGHADHIAGFGDLNDTTVGGSFSTLVRQ